ncbi:uncharacterized protein [Gossypium hirsutum]|uniref:Uncharacterized protein LOC107913944 isoform X1 n=1 Tax=Gossypium hirsutum TaxID=3635 RepID=A0A1U8K6H6_GOSHI|nr:uncharacterized protein LOC107913944 isoform X1 [Gossypium hirsutum]XP_016698111.1 uncharacterized protein LOC107913944 isoform X1 [Gossypium hirsutum]XP_040969539.1 uncharacterized protein LOC107913944 isoform X1 [Gossypium hirsutum]XP_040969541.1 uncharacterized protein LOC107913944 isoform X1 [Gossypium hirsutum]
MAEVVTEQWVQIQHLEQLLQIAKMRALQAQKQRNMRCTFLKFIDGISGRHLPKLFKALDAYSLGKGPIIRYYVSQALQQLKRFYSAIRRFHPENLACFTIGVKFLPSVSFVLIRGSSLQLQAFIKEEMQRNELTAAFVNDELVFFLASAFITFPVLGAWMLLLT